MEKDHLILESYRIYNESKERFTDRSFITNKFYLVLEIVLLVGAGLFATSFPNTLLVAILSAAGTIVAALWWFNQDSYQYLIKIKYKAVLEKLEEQLPVAPTKMEYDATQEDAKKNKIFVFTNAHKFLAFVVLLTFLSMFVLNLAPLLSTILTTEGV